MTTDDNGIAAASTRAGDGPADPFGSALTVREFALLEEGQIEPLAAVMGCELRWLSVWLPLPAVRPRRQRGPHVLSAAQNYARRWENDVIAVPALDAAITETRQRVLDQVRQEAAAVGADVVIGVRRVPGPVPSHELATVVGKRVRAALPGQMPRLNHPLDYQLIGTAVRDPARHSAQPLLSTLSVAEFTKLRRGGWQPAGVVCGCSHYFGGNVRFGVVAREVEPATEIWTSARDVAFEQLRTAMTDFSADGVIGLSLERDHWTFRLPGRGREPTTGILVRVSVIATAIRRAATPPPDRPSPMRILTLR